MDIINFISENMYIVVAVLYVLGMFIKAIPGVANWLIPFILTGVGIVLGIMLLGAPDGIIQGVLCAGGAVLVNQCIKQVETRNAGQNEAGEDMD